MFQDEVAQRLSCGSLCPCSRRPVGRPHRETLRALRRCRRAPRSPASGRRLQCWHDAAPTNAQSAGAVRHEVARDSTYEQPAREDDRFPRRLERGAAPVSVVRLGEAGAVHPHQRVADLPACVFDRAGEPVRRARGAERGEKRPGLGDAECVHPRELSAGVAHHSLAAVHARSVDGKTRSSLRS